jgi:hypothetical protein
MMTKMMTTGQNKKPVTKMLKNESFIFEGIKNICLDCVHETFTLGTSYVIALMFANNRDESSQEEDFDMDDDDERRANDSVCRSVTELNKIVPADAIDNSNNSSRTFKWTPVETVQENTERDGYTYAFISQAEGPMLSAKAKEQIMVLNYVLETPPSRERVMATAFLVPKFNSDNQLESLVERIPLSTTESVCMKGVQQDAARKRVDCIPFDMVCAMMMMMTMMM